MVSFKSKSPSSSFLDQLDTKKKKKSIKPNSSPSPPSKSIEKNNVEAKKSQKSMKRQHSL